MKEKSKEELINEAISLIIEAKESQIIAAMEAALQKNTA